MSDQMPERNSEQSWYEYRRLVLAELSRLSELITNLREHIDDVDDKRSEKVAAIDRYLNAKIDDVGRRVTWIEARAAAWGSLGGGIAGTMAAVLTGLILKLIHP